MSLKPKMGICKDDNCELKGTEQLLKSGRCMPCSIRRFRNYSKPKKNKPKKLPYKRASGEMGLFLEIWAKMPHVSFLDGSPLGNILKPIFFSHVLPKGTYPKWRLVECNIVLLTEQQHKDWHSKAKSDLLAQDPRWGRIFYLYDEYKRMDYENKIPLTYNA